MMNSKDASALTALMLVFLSIATTSPAAAADNDDDDDRCLTALELGCSCIRTSDAGTSTTLLHIRCVSGHLTDIPNNVTDPDSLTLTGNRIAIVNEIRYASLSTLYLQYNGIFRVSDGAFRRLGRLKVLVLAQNAISSLNRETFFGLRSLELLSLEGNPIYAVRADVFVGSSLPRLEFLKLSHCQIYEIEPQSFSGLSSLYLLNLTANNLGELPVFGGGAAADGPGRAGLDRLTELDLSDNRLRSLNGSALANMPSLERLMVSGNRVTELRRDSFCPAMLIRLRSLLLRGNRIDLVERGALSQLENLETIDFSFNSLTELAADELPWKSLGKVLVHDNPWDCSNCANVWLTRQNIVKSWNEIVTCGAPASLTGANVFLNSTFSRCSDLPFTIFPYHEEEGKEEEEEEEPDWFPASVSFSSGYLLIFVAAFSASVLLNFLLGVYVTSLWIRFTSRRGDQRLRITAQRCLPGEGGKLGGEALMSSNFQDDDDRQRILVHEKV